MNCWWEFDDSMTSVDHVQQSFVFIFTLNVIITLLGRDTPGLIRTTSSRTREKPDDVIYGSDDIVAFMCHISQNMWMTSDKDML